MATPFLQAACLPPRREGVQTMRRVRRVSSLPNRAFRLRQRGRIFRSYSERHNANACLADGRQYSRSARMSRPWRQS
jgi:hypothetical protein